MFPAACPCPRPEGFGVPPSEDGGRGRVAFPDGAHPPKLFPPWQLYRVAAAYALSPLLPGVCPFSAAAQARPWVRGVCRGSRPQGLEPPQSPLRAPSRCRGGAARCSLGLLVPLGVADLSLLAPRSGLLPLLRPARGRVAWGARGPSRRWPPPRRGSPGVGRLAVPAPRSGWVGRPQRLCAPGSEEPGLLGRRASARLAPRSRGCRGAGESARRASLRPPRRGGLGSRLRGAPRSAPSPPCVGAGLRRGSEELLCSPAFRRGTAAPRSCGRGCVDSHRRVEGSFRPEGRVPVRGGGAEALSPVAGGPFRAG